MSTLSSSAAGGACCNPFITPISCGPSLRGANGAAEKPRIFISYARSDSSALAEELTAGLEVAGFEPYLDRHDIAAAEDWEARLGGLIQSADTVVFILSPAAVKSPRCAWEVERAAELGERVIPVEGKPVPETEVPERLRRLNYIFFRESIHLGTPPPRWCYARNLWPFADAAPPPADWDEWLVAQWDRAAGWFGKARAGK
jgi:TIR domain